MTTEERISSIKILPKDLTFHFQVHQETLLSFEEQELIQKFWDVNFAQNKNCFNGIVYSAQCHQNVSEITVKLWPDTFAHKMASGKVEGVSRMIRASSPVLVETIDGKYLVGQHRTGVIIIPGGVLDDDHAKQEHPLLANATAELWEELGLHLDQGNHCFSYWIQDGDFNFFIVKLKISLSFLECERLFEKNVKTQQKPEMLELIALPKEIHALQKACSILEAAGNKIWPWLISLLSVDMVKGE